MGTGWEFNGTTFSSCGKMPLTRLSITALPNSNGTSRRVTTQIHALTRKSSNSKSSSITPYKITYFFVAAVTARSFIARILSVHVGGILDLRIKLGPA